MRRGFGAGFLLAAVLVWTSVRIGAAQCQAEARQAFWSGDFERALVLYHWQRRLESASLEAREGELEVRLALLESSAGAAEPNTGYRETVDRSRLLLGELVKATPLRPETWSSVADFFGAIKIANQRHRVYPLERISPDPVENLEPEDVVQIRALERATSVDPNGVYYRDALGDLCWNVGLRPLALGCYRKALELLPDPTKHLFLSGTALAPEVVQAAVEAMKRAPEPPRNAEPEMVYRNLGYLLLGCERFPEARLAFEQAERVSGRGYYIALQAYAADRQGQEEDAVRLYRKALARGSPDPDERYLNQLHLGEMLEKVGHHEEAAQEIRAALGMRPREPRGLLLLGRIDESLGRLDEAEDVYVRLTEISPEPITALVNLVEFYRRIGRPGEALVPARKLVELQPDEGVYRKLVQQLLSETDTGRAR